MSDTPEEVENIGVVHAASSAGAMLAAARESAGLTVEEAASQLRISVRQVLALEADDISALPGSTFVRGFIRNYAKLLNLDASELLQAHQVAAPDTVQSTITLQSENIPIVSQYKKSWLPYMMASAVVGLALAAWMAYMEYAPTTGTGKIPAPEKVTAAIVALPPTPAQPVTQIQPPVAQAEPTPVTSPPVEQAAPQQPVAANATAKLTLTFIQQSWVNVTDRDGKELISKSQPAGSQSAVEGAVPFSVVIGNAAGVQVSYNDKSVDLAPYTKSNVARLTLE